MDLQVIQFDKRVGMGTFTSWLEEMGCATRCCRCDKGALPGDIDGPLLLLGGYMGVNDREKLPYLQTTADWLAKEVRRGRPVLAICLGGQLLAHALGGCVNSQTRQEKGIRNIVMTPAGNKDPLLAGLPASFVSFEWHNDSFDLPSETTHLAQTDVCPGQVFRSVNAWGLQFHPEVDAQVVAEWCALTGSGQELIKEFRRHQETYFAHSQQILTNFIQTSQFLLTTA